VGFFFINNDLIKQGRFLLKILCFASGRLPNNLYFRYDNRDIEIVKEFNYLGILLNRTGNFNLAIKAQADKETRAMYEI
jgi:hypothetical protein